MWPSLMMTASARPTSSTSSPAPATNGWKGSTATDRIGAGDSPAPVTLQMAAAATLAITPASATQPDATRRRAAGTAAAVVAGVSGAATGAGDGTIGCTSARNR